MKRTLLILMVLASVAMAGDPPDFNNWTTESLKQIFIPPTRITRVHDRIKTVTFPFPAQTDGYPTRVYASECFDLLFLFLFGPNDDHKHDLESATIAGKITEKDRETGYLVTRDRDLNPKRQYHFTPDAQWRYHFVITKNDTTILTAELIESERLGPQFILHIVEPLHPDPAALARAAHDAEIRASNERALKRLNRAKESSVHGP
jgi:hypothetical protein